jgi:hypothetical protein
VALEDRLLAGDNTVHVEVLAQRVLDDVIRQAHARLLVEADGEQIVTHILLVVARRTRTWGRHQRLQAQREREREGEDLYGHTAAHADRHVHVHRHPGVGVQRTCLAAVLARTMPPAKSATNLQQGRREGEREREREREKERKRQASVIILPHTCTHRHTHTHRHRHTHTYTHTERHCTWGKHFVGEDEGARLVQPKLKLGVGNDDAFL